MITSDRKNSTTATISSEVAAAISVIPDSSVIRQNSLKNEMNLLTRRQSMDQRLSTLELKYQQQAKEELNSLERDVRQYLFSLTDDATIQEFKCK